MKDAFQGDSYTKRERCIRTKERKKKGQQLSKWTRQRISRRNAGDNHSWNEQ